MAETLSRLSNVRRRQQAYADATRLAERALSIREAALGPDHPEVADALTSLGAVQWDSGEADCVASHRRALDIRERVLGPDHPDVAQSLLNLSVGTDAPDVGVPLLKRALAILEQALGPDHPRVAYVLGNLAWYPMEEGRFEDALPLLERAYAITLQHDQGPLVRLWHLGQLGRIDLELGNEPRGEARLRQALQLAAEASVADSHRSVAAILAPLARHLRRTGRGDEAEPFVRRWEAARGEKLEDAS